MKLLHPPYGRNEVFLCPSNNDHSYIENGWI
jgi:hypothetical protein